MQPFNEQHPHRGDWLREIVFGLNDGLVTTLVFIMAVSEAASTRLLMVVLGGYLSARTEREVLEQRIATEAMRLSMNRRRNEQNSRRSIATKAFPVLSCRMW